MSETMRESLSALLDDEANELEIERILSKITEDAELRQTWVRYSAVRSVVSGQQTALHGLDISGSVRQAIAADDERAGDQADGGFKRFLRPVASFAVAASVAATVVIGGQQLAQVGGADPQGGGQSLAAGVSPVGMINSLGASPVQASFGTRSVPVLQPAAGTAYQELARQRMQQYMQEHAEHAALNSPHGLIPFARVSRIEE
jgi:sigma-E factor negative regulatory protein RseA